MWDGQRTGTEIHNKIWSRYPGDKLAELARVLGIKEPITGDVIYAYMKKYLAENTPSHQKAIDEFRERMKEDPALSYEYATHLLLEIFMMEGVYIVEEFTSAFGEDYGIQLWCKVWARWHEYVYDRLVEEYGYKDVGVPEIAQIFKRCLEDFGVPVVIVHSDAEKAVLRAPRCVYTELKFKDFPSLQMNNQCDIAMIPCNQAQLLSYAEKAGKRGRIVAKHNRELCQGDESCEWTLEVVGYDRSKTYFPWMKKGLEEYDRIQGNCKQGCC